MSGVIPTGTSTGSKRTDVLFGTEQGTPHRMVRSAGCRLWTDDGREYVDYMMALGAVGLGYAHPEVTAAAQRAAADGVIGSLPPVIEEVVAERLVEVVPGAQRVRFLKTGAEAAAAAIRVARVVTNRSRVLGCGYHGWLDWCSSGTGVPNGVLRDFGTIPFGDLETGVAAIQEGGADLAAVIVEPVVDREPPHGWLDGIRGACRRVGAVFILDEIKTAFRIATGGAAERWQIEPDLTVLGKALANGYPLSAVVGRADVMDAFARTWVSSTLATETVALAAADAVLRVHDEQQVCVRLGVLGGRLFAGLETLAARSDGVTVRGIPEMCYLAFDDDARSARFAAEVANRGILFKRSAYNFVSIAHDETVIDQTLGTLDEVMAAC